MELQLLSPQIIARLNLALGQNMIERLRFVQQAPPAKQPPARRGSPRARSPRRRICRRVRWGRLWRDSIKGLQSRR